MGNVRHCKDCNYMGPLVVEADGEVAEAIKVVYEREKKAGKGEGMKPKSPYVARVQEKYLLINSRMFLIMLSTSDFPNSSQLP